MGTAASCRKDAKRDLILAIGEGDLQQVKLLLNHKPELAKGGVFHSALSPLHYAASHGQPDVLLLLLENGAMVDASNSFKQTPLMLACKNGRLACLERLLEWGANVLMFDAYYERTCLHYAAKSGHLHCLQRIANAAQGPTVSETWGFARFINVRDGSGATPLHLAARAQHSEAVRLLLSNAALVGATTTKSGRSSLGLGSTPLHFAARGGSSECVKELLAWGANRLHKNSHGHTPFFIAMKFHNKRCAALLNPSTAEPLVWPSPWKFMSNLDPEAKLLLEEALAKANDAWENRIFAGGNHFQYNEEEKPAQPGNPMEDNEDENELCCICFEHECSIEIQDCGHQMCAGCILSLCSHKKANTGMATASTLAPACPFCRGNIERLERAPLKILEPKGTVVEDEDKNLSKSCAYINQLNNPVESGCSSGSGNLIGLVSKGSFRLLTSARGSGRVADIDLSKESCSDHEMIGQQ
ncbi:hypothetical protein GOP47_0019060 [Adiantum capillus-veneris]|uniref:RING-type E3 ubiquitin transferase n=1 Tax=Adiantum capillus-veneris TaxID=13818 RepID=A0A9D4UFR2_ADICA|nr:hypothetical protein GOP47_0019060 [Adiantum capillus-veneris]